MRLPLLLLASAALTALPVAAQTSSYRSATVQPGKPSRIWTVTALKKECSVGQIGGVKVVTPPKNGTLTLARAKAKTPANFRCPNIQTPVEHVLYQPNSSFNGSDEVSFETKSADGAVEKHTIRIDVSGKAAPPTKQDGLIDL